MKLKQWLYGATALAMLAACSDHDVAPNSGGNDDESNGYIGIKIQLPTTPSTRAEGDPANSNDNFDDGKASEYHISDAILLLFQAPSTSETTTKATTSPMYNAICIGAFDLKNGEATNTDDPLDRDPQITTYQTRVANVGGIDENKSLYALVMVNGGGDNGIYSSASTYKEWMKGKTIRQLQETIMDLKVDANATTPNNDKDVVINSLFTQTNPGGGYASHIFMTNSPLSSIAGGTNDPGNIPSALPVLVELNRTTYKTESEALQKPAGTIHVERAVGKITCSQFNKATHVSVTYNDGTKDYKYKLEVSSVSWGMAQDMRKTYVVRNTNRDKTAGSTPRLWTWDLFSTVSGVSDAPYRMLGHTPIALKNSDGTTAATYYRPYFCQVPGYGEKKDDNYEDKTFVHLDVNKANCKPLSLNSTKDAFASTGAFYPMENTFPVDFMKYANTTRVGFWVNFTFIPEEEEEDAPAIGDKVNFYISGVDKSTIYLDKDGKDPLTSAVIAELSNTTKYKGIKDAVDKAIKTGSSAGTAGSYSNVNLGDLLVFEYDQEKAKSGLVYISGIKFNPDLSAYDSDYFKAVPEYTFENDLIDSMNELGQYYKYTGGQVFYEVRIKHFGDDLTPWAKKGTNEAATNILQSYGSDPDEMNSNYLGRYGIVRNNWYDLNISAIKKLGSPTDPETFDGEWPGKPDDNKDQYIAVILKVLSWAKRTQVEEF